jgi:type II secretory ATPase GspE/PulE/Tfp pilus assembly ATPase PilB-like protein
MSEMINERISTKKLRAKALENGMVPLHHDGLEKVKAGIVSIEEVLRTATIDGPALSGLT